MKQHDLLDLAKKYFIFDAGLSKANLVRKIQREQGHTDCFATGNTDCDQLECWWRRECLDTLAEDKLPDASDVINHVDLSNDGQ